jgi:amino acid adenylation domain-containing protein
MNQLNPARVNGADAEPANTGNRSLLPLTRGQLEIYVEQKLNAESPLFNIGALVRIAGTADADRLIVVIRHVADSAAAFRTVVIDTDDGPRQMVLDSFSGAVDLIDLRGEADPEGAARRFMERDMAAPLPFGLNGPLARFAVVQCGPELVFWYGKFHHIVADGWGTSLFHASLIQCFNHKSADGSFPALELGCVSQQIENEAEYRASPAFETGRAYWQKQFPALPQPLFSQSGTFTTSAFRHTVHLHGLLYDRVRALAHAEKASPFHVLLGALAVVLSRQCVTRDLIIAVPILNRRTAVDKRTIGLYASVSPVRLSLDDGISMRELTGTVRSQLRRDYRYQRFPTAELKLPGLPEASARNRLHEVSLSYERHHYGEQIEGASNRTTALTSGHQNQPLKVFVRDYDDHEDIAVDFDFNESFFDPEAAKALTERFQRIISAALDEPDQRIAALPWLTPAEREWLVREVNAGPAVRPTGTLVAWFEATAAAHPLRTALSDGAASLSYAELDARANRLARRLRTLGVTAETPVGLSLERGAELIVGLLAILKAGGCYVPLDPAYPADRLAWLAEDGGLALVLTHQPAQAALAAALGQSPLPVVDLADAEAQAAAEPAGPLDHAPAPGQAAYVIYTSGSTGKPKGCVVSHANVTRLMAATEPQFGFAATDVWTLFHSCAFDFSVWEIWGALLYGGRLVVVPYWVSRAPEAFAELLERERVTVLNQTPSAFRQLIPATAGRSLALRRVVFGGEALEPAALAPWYAAHGATTGLVNMYGITETTVHVTYRALAAADAVGGRGSAIGRPLADLQVHLLDGRLEPVPVGVAGEIFVGGAGVARGYRNRPELTAERFLPDPFGPPGARLYRSGDRARRLSDGGLEYLGRADQQVKVRGFRIEPGEIEAALVRQPGVREALVLARPGPAGDPRLVAYVAAADGRGDAAAWRRALASVLPDYMVPSAFVVLDRFPLTHHGKIDRNALPAPEAAASGGGAAPATPAEQVLAAVWSEVLGVPRVGRDDNFFALGGDSILSLQVVSRARRRGLTLSPRQVFLHQSLRELANVAVMATGAGSETAAAVGQVPLTPIQHWFFSLGLERPEWWNQMAWLGVAGPLDPTQLATALDQIANAHDAFRLRFRSGSGGWTQWLVAGPASLPLSVYKLSDLPEGAITIQKSWDLAEGPLARAAWFAGENGSGVLAVAVHHLIVDGVSWRVLLDDLAGTLTGEPPAPALGFATWARKAIALTAPIAPVPVSRRRLPRTGNVPDITGSAGRLSVSFNAEETALITIDAPAASRTPGRCPDPGGAVCRTRRSRRWRPARRH